MFSLLQLGSGRHVVEDFSQNKDNVNTMFNNILENMKTFLKSLHATGHSLGGIQDATQLTDDVQPIPHTLKTSSTKTAPMTSTQSPDSATLRSTELSKRTETVTVSTLTPAAKIEIDIGAIPKSKSVITNGKQRQTSHLPSSTLSPSLRHMFKRTTSDTTLGIKKTKQGNRLAFREKKSIEPAPKTSKTVTTSPKTASTLKTTKTTAKPKLNPKCRKLKE